MKIPSIPADKAVHFVYGALASLLVVLLMILSALWWPRALEAAAPAGALVAALLGVLTELRQDALNEQAAERGEAPTHSVTEGDILATALGGLVPALPVGLLWLITKVF
jgi:Na+/proline symporter